eukprot:TRINITY_DN2768_c0_g1_i6.p1 TRINITY_DN2768_c0_g1~~TRINITY_DN2768_c0_g1_i6.p1  ORF type:complete len:639 (+),score=70.43 TRINITY_DN2768_c0_g1_i6:112-2028(+)
MANESQASGSSQSALRVSRLSAGSYQSEREVGSFANVNMGRQSAYGLFSKLASEQELAEVNNFKALFEFLRTLDVAELIFGPKHHRSRRRNRKKRDSGPDEFSTARTIVHLIVSSVYFNLFIGLATFFNMMVLIVEVDTLATSQPVPNWINTSTAVLMWTYAADVIMKIYAHRWRCLTDVSNLVDAIVVLLDLVFALLAAIADTSVPSVVFLRAFRLLRLYRLVKSVMIFRELVLMMQGLVSALRAIFFGAFLIGLALTAWSILAVQFLHPLVRTLVDNGHFEGCADCEDAFASVMKSNLTLWKTIVAGDGWGILGVPLLLHFPLSGLILLPAFVSISLGLVNVVAAVIVDRQTQARVNDDQLLHMMHQEDLLQSYGKLRSLFESLDADQGGSLTLAELEDNYETNDEFRFMLDVLDIQRSDIPTVCEIMDSDQSGDVTFAEFVEKLHQIKFLNDHTLLVFIKQHVDVMRREQSRLLENIDTLLHARIDASEKVGSAQGTTDEPESQENILRQRFQPVEESGDACQLHAEFSIDDVQKQLFQKLSSIMLQVVPQVAQNCVSYVNSSAHLASETSDCDVCNGRVFGVAPADISMVQEDLDMYSTLKEGKINIEMNHNFQGVRILPQPKPTFRKDSEPTP